MSDQKKSRSVYPLTEGDPVVTAYMVQGTQAAVRIGARASLRSCRSPPNGFADGEEMPLGSCAERPPGSSKRRRAGTARFRRRLRIETGLREYREVSKRACRRKFRNQSSAARIYEITQQTARICDMRRRQRPAFRFSSTPAPMFS